MDRFSDAARPDVDDWRLLVEQNPELTVLCDEHFTVLVVSEALLPVTGYRPDVVIGTDLRRLIHPDDFAVVDAIIGSATSAEPSTSFEVRARFADHTWHTLDGRASLLRLGPGARERLFLISARDVSADRRDSAALLRKIELESLLERVQQRFISARLAEAGDDVVTWALQEIGCFLGADRAYIVEFDAEQRTETMTHEWCCDGITPEIDTYRQVPFDALPGAWRRAEQSEILAIADVAALDDDWHHDRTALEAAGIRSILGFEITIDGRPFGDLGFDWLTGLATWTSDDLTALRVFAATFAQLLARRGSELRLARSLEQLRMAFGNSPVPLALIDIGGTFLEVNGELATLLGRDRADLVGTATFDLIRPEFHEPGISWGISLTETDGDGPGPFQVQLETPDGRGLWVEITARRIPAGTGGIDNFVLQVSDVTDALQARAALAASEIRFATLVDNLPDPVLQIDRAGNIVFSNERARQIMLPKTDNEYGLGASTSLLLSEHRVRAFETDEIQTVEFETETTSGRRTMEARFVPELQPDGPSQSLLLVATDLTDRKRTADELAHRAGHDDLTDLPNRSLFLAHLEVALARIQHSGMGMATVIFFDLDQFKNINDSLGHACGDALLIAVARRMRGFVRPGDVVARLGGDEFTVLLTTCTTIDQAMATATRMQQALSDPIEVDGRELIVSASGGVAITETGKDSPEDLMAWADAAMYRSKSSGRDRITLFDDGLAEQVRHRLDTDQKLRMALDQGEFEVFLQPEVDLTTGEILAAEALLRWRTAEGMVPAADFIEVAEQSGIIVPIGWWVLEQACRAATNWAPRAGTSSPVIVRVNLSAKQFDQQDLVERVVAILDSTGLPPGSLCLEITETALMSNAMASRDLLVRLDALGVELAIDDFGTGYSSLSYLKQFPADVLKIDRSFVDGLPGDPEDTAIVTTIIRLAETLGMTVTAEGIENRDQADRLVELGCGRGQGYLFSRPVPIEEFERKLAG